MSSTSEHANHSHGREILRLRELIDMEIPDSVWGEIIRGLVEVATSGDKGSVNAVKLLFSYQFGLPNQKLAREEAPPINIHTIEARLSERKPTRKHRTGRPRQSDGSEPAPGPVAGMEIE